MKFRSINISTQGYDGGNITINDTLLTLSGTYLANGSISNGTIDLQYTDCASDFSQATFSLGGVLGTGLGGLIVLLSGYEAMGLSHGAMMLVAMLLLYFLAKES